MILYRQGAAPVIRKGDASVLPGVLCRRWLVPYPGYRGAGADPWSGRYASGGAPRDATVEAGPGQAPAWTAALGEGDAGPVVVGPAPEAEGVYGAAAAAIAAARERGHGVVAVDCGAAAERLAPGADACVVALWRAGEEAWSAAIERAAGRGITAGLALPVIPEWTSGGAFLERLVAQAGGAAFVTLFELAGDGASRAAIHADLARGDAEAAERLFGRMHHGDPVRRSEQARRDMLAFLAARGLRTVVPRPVSAREPEANRRAIEALETAAEAAGEVEAQRLRRAAAAVAGLGRDLAALASGGNLRVLFAPDTPEGRAVGAALARAEALP